MTSTFLSFNEYMCIIRTMHSCFQHITTISQGRVTPGMTDWAYDWGIVTDGGVGGFLTLCIFNVKSPHVTSR